MAKHSPDSRQAVETLEEIEGSFDRVATWVSENPILVLGSIGGILLLAAIAGGVQSLRARNADAASEAVADVQGAFLEAMGAAPGTFEVVEPANPERAREIREEFTASFLEVAEAHEGSAAAVSARLEAGRLQATLGDPEGALETFRLAADEAPSGALEALARARLAAALESQGLAEEAAAAWARAAEIEHPAQDLARAQAARVLVAQGEEAQARSLAEAIDSAASAQLPAHLQAVVDGLVAESAAGSGAEAAQPQ